MNSTIKIFLFVFLFTLTACSNGDVYYISDIDTYVTILKTQKGCYISFEKSKVEKISIKKKDFILIPNISNLYIVYDSINKNDLHIYCVEEFNTTNAFLEYKSEKYNFDLYPYNKTDNFFRNFYDEQRKAYKQPYKTMSIELRDNQVCIDGKTVNKGNKFGKPN
jgi:hypothetical protein